MAAGPQEDGPWGFQPAVLFGDRDWVSGAGSEFKLQSSSMYEWCACFWLYTVMNNNSHVDW